MTASRIKPGDQLLGRASSGLHSNGFSLVRKALFEKAGYGVDDILTELGGPKLGDVLLTPTKIYAKTVLTLMKRFDIKGMAHITGGGITENGALSAVRAMLIHSNILARREWHNGAGGESRKGHSFLARRA